MKDIPQLWIKNYVDKLLALAVALPQGALLDAVLSRADHAMDLVKAFREENQ